MPDNLFSPDRLKDKIGKLPIWAWGIIGGTVLLAVYYLYTARKRARNIDAGVNGAKNDILASVGLGLSTPGETELAALPLGTSTGTFDNTNALGDTNLENNLSWLTRGVRIAGNNSYSALAATTALQKYLQGKPVTKTEAGIVNLVLNNLGYPPEGAPLAVQVVQDVIGEATKPGKKPVTKPKKVTSPVVVSPVVVSPVNPAPVVTSTGDKPFTYEERKLGIQGLNPIPVPITK